MEKMLSQEEKTRRGAADAGAYFHHVLDFVGFGPDDSAAIRESALVIEKHIPSIVADFYAHLLRYPPTRAHFLLADGSIDQDYLQKRMQHLANFWRRTASGVYDDEYARYVDYVGLAHTRKGADPKIYIEERYVIGQVGFMQRAISDALTLELREFDPDLEKRAVRAWNLVMMAILELLARVYRTGDEQTERGGAVRNVNEESVQKLAVQAYEMGLGLGRPPELQEVLAAKTSEIPEGQRKLVQVNDLSIGIFHHQGGWYALRNHCLHRGGPVATGELRGETLVCPWHGYEYNLTSGALLADPSVHLDMYPLAIRDDAIYLTVPLIVTEPVGDLFLPDAAAEEPAALPENEFLTDDLKPGHICLVMVNGVRVAVYNVEGAYYATADTCTHEGGPLSEGWLEGMNIVCPWHESCFHVATGAVICAPATRPVQTYRVEITGRVVRVSEHL